jgi:hypothetical protein
MSLYQCVLLKNEGGLRTGETIDSASLQAAVIQGRRIIAHRPHYDAFEIWEDERLLHSENNVASDLTPTISDRLLAASGMKTTGVQIIDLDAHRALTQR